MAGHLKSPHKPGIQKKKIVGFLSIARSTSNKMPMATRKRKILFIPRRAPQSPNPFYRFIRKYFTIIERCACNNKDARSTLCRKSVNGRKLTDGF